MHRHAHRATAIHDDGHGDHELAVLLLQFHRHRQQRINRRFKITTRCEALRAARHQQSATLLAHIKIHRPQEISGQFKGGHVVQDHAFGARDLPRAQSAQIRDRFHRESLPLQGLRHGIIQIGSEQQHTRTACDFDHGLMAIVSRKRIHRGGDQRLIMRHTRRAEAIRETNAPAAELHLDVRGFQLAAITQHGERHPAIARAAHLDLDEERLTKLRACRDVQCRHAEVCRLRITHHAVVHLHTLARQFFRDAMQRLRRVAITQHQHARRTVFALTTRKSERLSDGQPRLSGLAVALIQFRAFRPAPHHLGGVVQVMEAVISAAMFLQQLLPFRQALRHRLLR